jgi:hypothetical protein
MHKLVNVLIKVRKCTTAKQLRVQLIISTNKRTRTSLSLFSLLKECPNTHFGNYITIICVVCLTDQADTKEGGPT